MDEISFTHPKYEVYLNASLSYGKDSQLLERKAFAHATPIAITRSIVHL